MTTIAYRDSIMAADSGSWMGGASHGWAQKLARASDGTLYGTSGHAPECHAYLDWIEAGREGEEPKPRGVKDDESSFIVLRVTPAGPIELLTAFGVERYAAPYFAIGAGAEAAFGALYMGATSEQAINAANEHGSGAFGDVRTIRHSGASAGTDLQRRVARSLQVASEKTGIFQSRWWRR